MKNMKNCPCCDGESSFVYDGTNVRVQCKNCGLSTSKYDAQKVVDKKVDGIGLYIVGTVE